MSNSSGMSPLLWKQSVAMALGRCIYYLPSAEDVTIQVNMQNGDPWVGQDAVLSIILKNNFTSARSFTL